MTTVLARRTVDLNPRRPLRRDIGLSAGQVCHRAGRDPLVKLVPVRPDLAGLGRHRHRVVALSPAYCLLITTVYVLHLAAGQTWAWERRHHEAMVEAVRFWCSIAWLLTFAAGLAYVTWRSA
jgi:hypothetical protein